jgi:hypothetical protein
MAIIMSIGIHKAPAATRSHWIVITEVTAISTLERLIVDCQTLTIPFLYHLFLGVVCFFPFGGEKRKESKTINCPERPEVNLQAASKSFGSAVVEKFRSPRDR